MSRTVSPMFLRFHRNASVGVVTAENIVIYQIAANDCIQESVFRVWVGDSMFLDRFVLGFLFRMSIGFAMREVGAPPVQTLSAGVMIVANVVTDGYLHTSTQQPAAKRLYTGESFCETRRRNGFSNSFTYFFLSISTIEKIGGATVVVNLCGKRIFVLARSEDIVHRGELFSYET